MLTAGETRQVSIGYVFHDDIKILRELVMIDIFNDVRLRIEVVSQGHIVQALKTYVTEIFHD